MQGITASNVGLHRRGCGRVTVELHIVVSANVKNKYVCLLLNLKPTDLYNIEKHVKYTLILKVNCVFYRLWASCIPKNIDSFYTQNESLYL